MTDADKAELARLERLLAARTSKLGWATNCKDIAARIAAIKAKP